ncbi:twin-arginine translocation signal domain-containing protein, partial [Mesorhizobium sp.]
MTLTRRKFLNTTAVAGAAG